ncbi:hypothetical protein NPIL_80261 [Nephila pilipes]|uniref:Uncharacterized protein n=1 Tax=Nephila pilipes TaxID=299642 RepID=A0A8X6U630_NEPPI|nr:hypothetical protein NPIL_80261 [Nephila pilipes]
MVALRGEIAALSKGQNDSPETDFANRSSHEVRLLSTGTSRPYIPKGLPPADFQSIRTICLTPVFELLQKIIRSRFVCGQ